MYNSMYMKIASWGIHVSNYITHCTILIYQYNDFVMYIHVHVHTDFHELCETQHIQIY